MGKKGGGGGAKAAKAMCKEAIRGKGTSETVKDREENVKAIFAEWDTDGSGFITKDELIEAMAAIGLKKKDAEKLLDEADENKDERISYDELVSFLFRAPNLEKYFEKLCAINTKKLEDAEKAHSKAKGGNFGPKMNDLEAKYQKKIDKELTPLLKKTFAFHDKDGSGVLEYDESIIFFSNFASLLVKSSLDCTANTSAHQMKWVGCIDWTNLKYAFQDNEDALFEKLIAVLKIETNALLQDYTANQDDRHRAGFKVLDVSGDGNLQEEEVVKALIPGHPENMLFMKAMGLVVSRDKLLEGAMAGR